MSHGRYRLWAAVASVAFHIIILSVLAASQLYPQPTELNSNQSDRPSLASIKSIINNSPVVPKPRVRQINDASIIPLRSNLPLDEQTLISKTAPVNNQTVPVKPNDSPQFAWSQQSASVHNVEFFSCESDCERICYLVDCSGSMKGLLEQVKAELARSVSELRPNQYFTIIFFGDDRLLTFAGDKLARASQYDKNKALAFIKSVTPSGKTNALAGFDLAVKIKNDSGLGPQVIMFLTDGFELAQGDVYQFRKQIMETRKSSLPDCAVNTIGFWPGSDDKKLLQNIAQSTGGQFACIEQTD
ncbi:MAG: VWA domain-containing protein [Phycisphaerae bacterium]